jgi:hypothetical protein
MGHYGLLQGQLHHSILFSYLFVLENIAILSMAADFHLAALVSQVEVITLNLKHLSLLNSLSRTSEEVSIIIQQLTCCRCARESGLGS